MFDRRTFLRGAAAVAGLVLVGRHAGSSRVRAYAFDAAPGASIWVGSGHRFDVEVRREGAAVEVHRNVTAASVLHLDSTNFRVFAIAAPEPLA